MSQEPDIPPTYFVPLTSPDWTTPLALWVPPFPDIPPTLVTPTTFVLEVVFAITSTYPVLPITPPTFSFPSTLPETLECKIEAFEPPLPDIPPTLFKPFIFTFSKFKFLIIPEELPNSPT